MLRALTRPTHRPALAAAAIALLLAACSDDGGNADSTTTTEAATTLAPTTTTEAAPVALFGSVDATDGPFSTLTGIVTAEVPDGATVTATIDGPGTTAETLVSTIDGGVEVQLLGLRAESDYTVTLLATSADGEDTADITFTSGALPADLPPMDLRVNTDQVADGITLFDADPWGGVAEGTPSYILGLDRDGEVVWYHANPTRVEDIEVTGHHTVLFNTDDVAIREVDLLGRPVVDMATQAAVRNDRLDLAADAVQVPIESSHHEITELPNGNLLTLSTALVPIDPADAQRLCGRSPLNVVEDVVVEFDREGTIVHEWKMSDYYSPADRPGSDLCVDALPIGPPGSLYDVQVVDWTHANAAFVDEASNSLIVSLRHLDAVIAIRYADDADGPAGELLWELGPEGTIEFTDGSEPFSHQHAPEFTADGSLLLFDNGNTRPTTFPQGDLPGYSRAVAYRLDLEAGTATQVFEHRDLGDDGNPTLALFLGDANELPNGNVAIDYGGMALGQGQFASRLVEVTADGTVARDLHIGLDQSWTVYRTCHVATLTGGEGGSD